MSHGDVPGAGGRRRGESREELLARIAAEQEALHPTPMYTDRSKRRLRQYLVAIFPLSFALAGLTGWLLGWSPLEWIAFAVGLVLAFAYIGYVLITERDDGRIHRSTRALLDERAEDAGARAPSDPGRPRGDAR